MTGLVIDGLSVAIGSRTVLNDITLAVKAGEILGLVGESGAGKSMVTLSIAQLLPEGTTLNGAIRLDGQDLTKKSEAELCRIRGREIGLVFQEPMTALNPLMTIGDQIAECAQIHRSLPRDAARILARETLDRVGLPAAEVSLSRYPHELSGGQRQRVAIAIAIVLGPKLLLADEPTTALDVTTQAEILELLKSLVRERSMALVLVSHDLAVIARMADRIAVMKDGAIVENDDAVTVLARPQATYTRQLLADSMPRIRKRGAAASTQVIVQATNIVRDYPRPRSTFWSRPAPHRALDGVSLSISRGEIIGLVGESGSGKTTLLRALLALDRPKAGNVVLDGESFTHARGRDLRRMRRRIQAVFQDPFASFDPRQRVEQIVAEPFHLLDTRIPRAMQRSRVDAMLERVGLASTDARRFADEFSGGQRQRIAIARALIVEPDIVVLDEAVSALDVTIRASILELLADLSDRLGVAYLFVSHDLTMVRAIADRVAVMQRGRIVEEGPVETVFGAPRHPYTAALLAATPALPVQPGDPSRLP